MITRKGNVIEINDKTEWLLFNRLSRVVNPVDFLSLTDGFIEFPGLLFVFSFLIMVFTQSELWLKFAIPAMFCFTGHLMINFHFGMTIFRMFKFPAQIYSKYSLVIVPAVFAIGFVLIGWWAMLALPLYLLTDIASVVIMNIYRKKQYRKDWNTDAGYLDIFRINAFLTMYRFFAKYAGLPKDLNPTPDEEKNQDWLKPYNLMRANWQQIEPYFSKKARVYWKIYLHI